MGVLQVGEEYRRRGLGALVTKAISRKVAEMGYDVCAVGNAPSEALFEKLDSNVLTICMISERCQRIQVQINTND